MGPEHSFPNYSARSASTGLTEAARSAGRNVAIRTGISSKIMEMAYTHGLPGANTIELAAQEPSYQKSATDSANNTNSSGVCCRLHEEHQNPAPCCAESHTDSNLLNSLSN